MGQMEEDEEDDEDEYWYLVDNLSFIHYSKS